MKILVNGRTFRKWNTANKQAKKDKEVEVQLWYKFNGKYKALTTQTLVSNGDLKNEILELIDIKLKIEEEKRYKYFKDGDIKRSNATLQLIKLIENDRYQIKEYCI